MPAAHILLLGLTPRSDRFGRAVEAVRKCNGGLVTYTDIGGKLRPAQPLVAQRCGNADYLAKAERRYSDGINLREALIAAFSTPFSTQD